MNEELESSVVGVLERHGPQPKHALVNRLNEGRVAQLDHGEVRDALTSLERAQKVIWTGGVVRLAGTRADMSGIVDEDLPGQTPEWEELVDEVDSEGGLRIEGPDVPVTPAERVTYLVATDWHEVQAEGPDEAADEVLGKLPESTKVMVVGTGYADVYERALVTRRVG